MPEMYRDAERFDFQLLREADLPLLHEWLGRPHVAEWWGWPTSLADVTAEYSPARAAESGDRHYVAHLDGEPVGFIQSYVVMNPASGWWLDERDPGARGIDQFLADGARLGQGIGTAMVRAFVTRLFADPAVTRVQTDPSPDNGRAIRCYEKAGFRAAREVDTPDGRALLMVCERPPVLTLRRAAAPDVDALHALLSAAGEHLAAQGFANWLPLYPRARIAADVEERAVYVAEAADVGPVGAFMLGAVPHRPYEAMAWACPDAPAQYLNRLAVHPAWQGRGVAAWCLAQMQRLAREAGAAALRCDVLRANTRLCRLYERHGFVARGTRDHSGWTFNCYERVLV